MFSKELFIKRLKALRLKENITLEHLGSLFNVTKQTASRWETGDRFPSIETLYGLAEHFNVSIDYLTGRIDNSNIISNNTDFIADEESELLEDFRQLNKHEQNIILGKISEMIYNKNIERNNMEVAEEIAGIGHKDRLNK